MSEQLDSNLNLDGGSDGIRASQGGNSCDPLHLTNSDHPGMSLVAIQFTGANFQSWSRAVRMALGAKVKLGFINGMCARPEEGTVDLERWIRCDYMVLCWLLNSMKPELAENFLYVTSAKELWEEVKERFAESNAPLIYQLQKEIHDLKQENLSVVEYFGKRKRAWDELQTLQGTPTCTCGAMKDCSCLILKKILEREATAKLMDFLMGLNDQFELARSNILATDPLPSVNRAFQMITQVERHKGITFRLSGNHEVFAAGRFPTSKFEKGQPSGKGNDQKIDYKPEGKGDGRSDFKRDFKKAKMDRTCTYCKEKGHLKETCFKLVGIPDWYKELKTGNGKSSNGAPNGKFVGNIGSDVPTFGGVHLSHPLAGDAESHTGGQERRMPDEHMINALIAAAVKKVRGKGVEGQSPPTDGMSFAGPFN